MFNIEPKYFDYETTPRKWLNFIRYFWLPVGAVFNLINSVTYSIYELYFIGLIIFSLAIMQAVACGQLCKRKWSAFNSLIAVTVLFLLYSLAELVLGLYTDGIVQIIVVLAFMLPTFKYLLVRRPIFTPWPVEENNESEK